MAECLALAPEAQSGQKVIKEPQIINMQLNGAQNGTPNPSSEQTNEQTNKYNNTNNIKQSLNDKITKAQSLDIKTSQANSETTTITKLTNNNTERAKFFSNTKLSLENNDHNRYDINNRLTSKSIDIIDIDKDNKIDKPYKNDLGNNKSILKQTEQCDKLITNSNNSTNKNLILVDVTSSDVDKMADNNHTLGNSVVNSGIIPEQNGMSPNTEPSGASTDAPTKSSLREPEPSCSSQIDSDEASPGSRRLRLENERLQNEVSRLRKLLQGEAGEGEACAINDDDRVAALEIELQSTKEALSELKIERKRLKAEKLELLGHVRQLCASLQDKEQELRDFIRNYEQRMRDSESSAQRMSSERERERWSLLRHARDEAERSLALAAQLSARELQLQRAQEQLQEARRQLSGCMSDQESLASLPRGSGGPLTPPSGLLAHHLGLGGTPGDRGSCSADSGVRGSSDRESAGGNLSDGQSSECHMGGLSMGMQGANAPTITVDPDSVSLVSSCAPSHMYQSVGTPKERSPTLSPQNAGAFSRSVDSSALSRSVEQLGSPLEMEAPPPLSRRVKGTLSGRSGRGGTWGSISRVFARSRHRTKNSSHHDNDNAPPESWSPLTEEGYAEKLRLLREASTIPMDRWRAPMVLAWLEVALGMPQYGPRCAENVKSGKVLLELSDAELEAGLGATHPMHRKKLRLAIEEQRRPELCRYPSIAQLGHTWVASEWLPDLGLAQYAESFAACMVDARMLDTLSKKELEKFLGVTRKFHQASVVHGIHLLRIVKYDRQALAVRRHQCETIDADPLVWTNQRFIRWARAIDLAEYADNLKDSGVHGGLVVLEPSFNGDTMATALGIPPSKNIIRRHLATELEALVMPARSLLGQGFRSREPYGSHIPVQQYRGTLGRASSRSCAAGLPAAGVEYNNGNDRRGSLRGSLSRAFKLRPRSEKVTSPTPSSSSEGASSMGAPLYAPPLPPGPPPSHRVSAPPPMMTGGSLHRQFAQHRRVKSIGDIEVVAATPV